MKNIKYAYLIISLLMISCSNDEPPSSNSEENIYDGSVVLESREDVLIFIEECYTEITGNITIRNLDVNSNDLSPLSLLTKVGGYVNIYNCDEITNIDWLMGLEFIGGFLRIASNQLLQNLDGLSNLEAVKGIYSTQYGISVEINNNSSLDDFCGLILLTQNDGAKGIYHIINNADNFSEEDIANGICN